MKINEGVKRIILLLAVLSTPIAFWIGWDSVNGHWHYASGKYIEATDGERIIQGLIYAFFGFFIVWIGFNILINILLSVFKWLKEGFKKPVDKPKQKSDTYLINTNHKIWWIHINNETVGPINLKEIKNRFHSGEINLNTLACGSKITEWTALKEINGMSSYLISDTS